VNKCSPLATIVIVNYNYDAFVAAAIDSALAQSYAPVEVIVVCEGGVRSPKLSRRIFPDTHPIRTDKVMDLMACHHIGAKAQ
jgi:GT2 family glycosyltransferase